MKRERIPLHPFALAVLPPWAATAEGAIVATDPRPRILAVTEPATKADVAVGQAFALDGAPPVSLPRHVYLQPIVYQVGEKDDQIRVLAFARTAKEAAAAVRAWELFGRPDLRGAP
jgi:hypothetical protein